MNPHDYRKALNGEFPVVLTAEDRAAFTMTLMTGTYYNYPTPDIPQVGDMLKSIGNAVEAGDLTTLKRTLAAQVTALDQIFHRLMHVAMQMETESLNVYERYMRLAYRAQTQSARTLAILNRICETHPAPEAKAESATSPRATEAPVRSESRRQVSAARAPTPLTNRREEGHLTETDAHSQHASRAAPPCCSGA